IVCAKPDDNRLPCPPVLTFEGPECSAYLAELPCSNTTYEHDLSWVPDISGDCDDELSGYKLYFTPDGESGQFELVAELSSLDLETTIANLSNYRGCYYITAIDRSGNESEPSN